MEILTQRCTLRPLVPEDFDAIFQIMNGKRVREVWEHAFAPEDVNQWIERRRKGYRENGIDYLLAVNRETGEPVGQVGLLREEMDGRMVWSIGWILGEAFQGQGYATECARAVADYAFDEMQLSEIYCDIRPQNEKSLAVAARLGMSRCGSFVKHYRGMEMVHDVFCLKKEERSWKKED